MPSTGHPYLSSTGRDWLLPIYDPLTTWLGVSSVHRALLDEACIRPGQRVIEIGCGTGNLAILAKRLCLEADIVGMDPDLKALARAQSKAVRMGIPVRFDPGFSQQLPYPDGSFDRVLSAFMFHHLRPEEKLPTLLEARRVLRPAGSLHLVDFASAPHTISGLLSRLCGHGHDTRLDAAGSILALLRAAGFLDSYQAGQRKVLLGRIAFFSTAACDSPA